MKPPKVLNDVVDAVLAYKPKPKSKATLFALDCLRWRGRVLTGPVLSLVLRLGRAARR